MPPVGARLTNQASRLPTPAQVGLRPCGDPVSDAHFPANVIFFMLISVLVGLAVNLAMWHGKLRGT